MPAGPCLGSYQFIRKVTHSNIYCKSTPLYFWHWLFITANQLLANCELPLSTNVAVLADVSVISPGKFFVFITRNNIFWVEVPRSYCI